MTPDATLGVFQQTLYLIMLLVSIILLPGLVVGLIVSMFQAATQINEMTLTFIPKLLVTFTTLLVAGPWMLGMIVEYTQRLVQDIPYLIG